MLITILINMKRMIIVFISIVMVIILMTMIKMMNKITLITATIIIIIIVKHNDYNYGVLLWYAYPLGVCPGFLREYATNHLLVPGNSEEEN